MNKVVQKILIKIKDLLYKVHFFDLWEDKKYLKLIYFLKIGKKLNLDNPITFNEKLQWLKLNDRNELYSVMVDKYAVKEYVKQIIGEEYIIPTLGCWDYYDDIHFDKLPDKFILKCTHDSGGTVICKNKEKFDNKKARNKIEKCLKRNYYYLGREWPYKNVKPRIIAEEYMTDNVNEDLLDYKIMCFDGVAKMIFTCSDRRSKKGLAVDFFDLEWNHLPFRRHYRNSEKEILKPKKLDEMILLAEKLSRNIPFVRVDFYEIDEKIYFGELTFYPGSGLEEFIPDIWDENIGKLIRLKDEE